MIKDKLRRHRYSYGTKNLLSVVQRPAMVGRSAAPEQAHMPTQKRESARNYIGLLNDEAEEQRAVEVQSAADRRMREYFRGLVAAMLNRRRGEAR